MKIDNVAFNLASNDLTPLGLTLKDKDTSFHRLYNSNNIIQRGLTYTISLTAESRLT
jgi:hypothetical protein